MYQSTGELIVLLATRLRVTARRSRAAAVGVAVGMITGLGLVLGGASPAAAATCGSRCDGKNPQTFAVAYEGPSPGSPVFCKDDAVTKVKKDGLEVRYSAYCRTAWGRIPNPDDVVGAGTRWYIEVESFNADGSKRKTVGTPDNVDTYTKMVNDAGLKARTCLWTAPSADNPFTKAFCTGKY
jgi:hypothetical protein